MEALDGSGRSGSQDDSVYHAFHPDHADALFDQLRHNKMRKAPVVRIHDAEGIWTVSNLKLWLAGNVEHMQMNVRVLVAGEADVPKLARLPRLDKRGVRTLLIEDPGWGSLKRMIS